MDKDKAIKVLDMFLYKQCDLERTSSSYDSNTVWSAVYFARDQLEAQIPKVGEWQGIIIDGQSWAITCSNCHQVGFIGRTPYCPNCGAKMRGDVE